MERILLVGDEEPYSKLHEKLKECYPSAYASTFKDFIDMIRFPISFLCKKERDRATPDLMILSKGLKLEEFIPYAQDERIIEGSKPELIKLLRDHQYDTKRTYNFKAKIKSDIEAKELELVNKFITGEAQDVRSLDYLILQYTLDILSEKGLININGELSRTKKLNVLYLGNEINKKFKEALELVGILTIPHESDLSDIDEVLKMIEEYSNIVKSPPKNLGRVLISDEKGLIGSRISTQENGDLRTYLLREYLGEGGTGIVYRARYLNTNKDVALKVIHPNRELIDRIERSMELVVDAECPNLIGINYVGKAKNEDKDNDEEDINILVTEFLKGKCLDDIIRESTKKGLDSKKALKYLKDINKGLGILHKYPALVLLDLNPLNVMIVDKRGAVLSDLDTLVRATVKPEKISGKLEYMGWGQLNSLISDKHETYWDICSAAITLFEMVSGDKPVKLEGKFGEISEEVNYLINQWDKYARDGDKRKLPSDVNENVDKAIDYLYEVMLLGQDMEICNMPNYNRCKLNSSVLDRHIEILLEGKPPLNDECIYEMLEVTYISIIGKTLEISDSKRKKILEAIKNRERTDEIFKLFGKEEKGNGILNRRKGKN